MSLLAPPSTAIDGTRFSFGVVASRYNPVLVDALLAVLSAKLAAAGVKEKGVEVIRVPGAHEIPVAAQWLAQDQRHDCVIALGVLIGGDTNHHEMVGQSVSHALQQISIGTKTPVINGVIVANTLQQAEARCRGSLNRGAEFASAALEMAALKRTFSHPPKPSRAGKGKS